MPCERRWTADQQLGQPLTCLRELWYLIRAVNGALAHQLPASMFESLVLAVLERVLGECAPTALERTPRERSCALARCPEP